MNSVRDRRSLHRRGFPIRIPPDQSLLSGSPRLYAACRVLHRLLAPRHPPCALSSLTAIERATTLEHSNKCLSLITKNQWILIDIQMSKSTDAMKPPATRADDLRRSSPARSDRSRLVRNRVPRPRTNLLRSEVYVLIQGVEPKGIEPSTSGLQSRRSPN
jgi:hypothetical protein